MPTYEYVCEKCGHEFEKFQSMSDPKLTRCPKEVCAQKRWGKGKVRKLVGLGAGLIFKGSGFYITDYRSEGYKEAAKKESGATDGKTAKSDKNETPVTAGKSEKPAPVSESKPAVKADAKPAKPAESKNKAGTRPGQT